VFTNDKKSLRVHAEREAGHKNTLSVDLPPETMADIARGFSEETKERRRMDIQAERDAAIMRWMRAANAPEVSHNVTPCIAHGLEPDIAHTAEPHFYQQPGQQQTRGIRP
jgi:hypothetical protein